MKVFIGWDSREEDAYKVAEHSLRKHSSLEDLEIIPIKQEIVREMGIYNRTDDKPGEGKRTHEGDKVSNQKSLKKSLPQHHCNPPHGDEDGNDRHRLNPLLQEDPCQHCGDQGASTENKEGVCDRGEADG